jgi:condensin complex subunit 1
MMEDKDNAKTIPGDMLDIICIAVKKYNHRFGAKTSIILNLKAYDHLSDLMADMIALSALKHEDTSLLEEVLRDIGKMEFNINENDVAGAKSTVPKSFARFLLRLSERLPKEVMKQMVTLQKHFDAQSYTIRMGMVELVGNLIQALFEDDDREAADKHIDAFCDILMERYRDTNAFVRGKVLQMVLMIACLEPRREKGEAPRFAIPLQKRSVFVDLTIGRLHDKTSNVRRNAIKTLAVLVNNHPYATPQTQRSLNLKKLKGARAEIEVFLKSQQHLLMQKLKEAGVEVFPDDGQAGGDVRMEDINLDHMDIVLEATASNLQLDVNQQDVQVRMIPALQLALKWIDDALQLSAQIEQAMPTLCELLVSKTKSEVIEAMEFLVVCYRFEMDCTRDGLRKMVHLIWNKDVNSEEGRSVKDTLIECFYKVYLEPEAGNEKEAIGHMVRSLIGLTKQATLADLTSLESLLGTMMQRGRIPDLVIRQLWAMVANIKSDVPKLNRRGSLLILSMLAKCNQDVVADHIEVLLRVGLGKQGREDLVLARTACTALQQLGEKKKAKGSLASASQRWPMTNPVFPSLVELVEAPTMSDTWFPFAEQAVNAIYLLAEHPDQICSATVKRFAARVFGLQVPEEAGVEEVSKGLASSLRLTSPEPLLSPTQQSVSDVHMTDSLDVARFLFLVGHCAIKQIVHLENIESEFKRRQAVEESKRKNPTTQTKGKNKPADEIENVVGTADDEFGDQIALIRERELLYGNKSLLALFGPIVAYMCSNNRAFDVRVSKGRANFL